MTGWLIYQGLNEPHDGIDQLPAPPNWRNFRQEPSVNDTSGGDSAAARRLGAQSRAAAYRPSREEIELVNAAMYLRRPLLVTGKPGTGKSTLAYSVATELKLGLVLAWSVTSKSTRQEGLYQYDALARLRDHSLATDSAHDRSVDIGRYIRLGPLGTALLPSRRPRVLLIDELDKSDIDLPSDLLSIFEDGEYEIPELTRIAAEQLEAGVRTHDTDGTATITAGKVRCDEFPFVIITSNGDRDFSPPFLRRCLQLEMKLPERGRLEDIVKAHLGSHQAAQSDDLIEAFMRRRTDGELATDQLLNAIYLRLSQAWPGDRERLVESVMQYLNASDL